MNQDSEFRIQNSGGRQKFKNLGAQSGTDIPAS
jgi:hypothetical protein